MTHFTTSMCREVTNDLPPGSSNGGVTRFPANMPDISGLMGRRRCGGKEIEPEKVARWGRDGDNIFIKKIYFFTHEKEY